jgi:hypothetical protein
MLLESDVDAVKVPVEARVIIGYSVSDCRSFESTCKGRDSKYRGCEND